MKTILSALLLGVALLACQSPVGTETDESYESPASKSRSESEWVLVETDLVEGTNLIYTAPENGARWYVDVRDDTPFRVHIDWGDGTITPLLRSRDVPAAAACPGSKVEVCWEDEAEKASICECKSTVNLFSFSLEIFV